MTPREKAVALTREVRAAVNEVRMKTGNNDVAVTVETEPHVRIRVWRRAELLKIWQDLPEYAEWIQVGLIDSVVVFLLNGAEDTCSVFCLQLGAKDVVLN